MQKPRRYERIFLFADASVQPNRECTQRLPAKMFDVSKAGAAVFSEHHFSPGEIVGMELNLPTDGRGLRTFRLYGTVRHAHVEPDGSVLGIEFVVGENAGDYERFARYMEEHASRGVVARRHGFTLVEACIAMTVVCILATMAIPLYTRAVEQARVEVASAKLATIWSAQRVYWLERRSFAPDLWKLDAMDLLDPSIPESQASPDAVFVYQIVSAADDSFLATATRAGSSSWTGQLTISESGQTSGAILGPDGQTLTPPS